MAVRAEIKMCALRIVFLYLFSRLYDNCRRLFYNITSTDVKKKNHKICRTPRVINPLTNPTANSSLLIQHCLLSDEGLFVDRMHLILIAV